MIRVLVCLVALGVAPAAHAGLPTLAGSGPTGVHIGNPTGAQDDAPVQVVTVQDPIWSWFFAWLGR